MNPFLLSARERLTSWKLLRNSLKDLPEPEQLTRVASYWAQCPIRRFAIDPENPRSWVTCWEMLHQNDFDQNAIALGMEMTLRLAGWNPARLKLVMIDDREHCEMRMVLKIDDQMLLNYNHSTVCGVANLGCDEVYQYQHTGKSWRRLDSCLAG